MISKESNKILKASLSSHFIYENINDRNQKRFSQFSKRKNALSLDKKGKNKFKFKYNKNISDKNINNTIDIINVFNLIINKYNINETKEKPKIKSNNFNQDNNLIKENNILNLDEEKDILIEHYQNNSIDYNNNIDNNSNDIMNKNEFALNYLTPYRKSFIKLGNNLTTKLKMQNDNFTDSYILALGLDEKNNAKDKYQILQNFDTIKEEKEKENKFKTSKSLSKYIIIHKKPKKLIRKKIYLSLEKSERKNCNNISPKKNLLLVNNYYKSNYKYKNSKLKIIKLNIENYDKNFVKINIEKKGKIIV